MNSPPLNNMRRNKAGAIGRGLDSFVVREWFAVDPAACISDLTAQQILREYEHSYRWWFKFPGKNEQDQIKAAFDKAVQIWTLKRTAHGKRSKRENVERVLRKSSEKFAQREIERLSSKATEALFNDQFTPWWQSLRNYICTCVPREVADRFADYLAGFLLVQENETPRSTAHWKKEKGKEQEEVTNTDWRQVKKLLKKLAGGSSVRSSMLPATANPPQQESLKTRLIVLMFQELVALDYSRKLIADKYLPMVWNAIGEGIRDSSLLRVERRSRQRTRRSK